jgi:endonuclease/exonuclease/phosphatase (EEP) superfamily protein YafD
MAFTRAVTRARVELCVANLHASAGAPLRRVAEREVELAAARAVEWSEASPLILGGDLNLRPRDSATFDRLADRYGLSPPTAPGSLDHLLARGLEVVAAPSPWPAERREVREGGLAIRLSDHAPVAAVFRAPAQEGFTREGGK